MAVDVSGNDVPDRVAKKQLARFRDKVEEEALEHQQAYLNITPMMDMMTILLVFLLKQFSVQQTAAALSEGLQLPQSTIEQQKPPGVMVQVTQSAIIVDGDPVAPVRNGSVDEGGSCSPSDIEAAAACTENCLRRKTSRMVIMSIIGVMLRYACWCSIASSSTCERKRLSWRLASRSGTSLSLGGCVAIS